jgi:hypothetical protein
MPPEATFYDWLRRNLKDRCHFQRIETTTGSGVPDVQLTTKQPGFVVWIELKALSMTNVQIRNFQFAWIAQYPKWNAPIVLNRCINTGIIGFWRYPFRVEYGRKGHVKIVSTPTFACLGKDFVDLFWKHTLP